MKTGIVIAAAVLVVGLFVAATQESKQEQDLRSIMEDLRWMESYRFHQDFMFKTTNDGGLAYRQKNPWCDIETCIARHRAEMRDAAAKARAKVGDK